MQFAVTAMLINCLVLLSQQIIFEFINPTTAEEGVIKAIHFEGYIKSEQFVLRFLGLLQKLDQG